ncbi:MAG TPA: GNAT family protein [Dehalococcoidia bacterium]|nr:GNAT family protein [Dehalococcoidia bacterium]
MKDIFTGKLVRLAARRPEDAELFSLWGNDSEYRRYQDSRPAMPESAAEFASRPEREPEADRFEFRLRTIEDDQLIGFVNLLEVQWSQRNAMLAVGVADREYWGKGYGSDAVSLALRYAFDELNLHRLNLNVWSLNPRAIRAYEKAGFVRRALLRGDTLKDAVRSDSILMSITQDEWRARSS